MNLNSLELPNDLLEAARSIAAENQVSLEEWVSGAIAQRVEWEKTQQVFRRYGEKADFETFDRVMARVPDVAPLSGDELLEVSGAIAPQISLGRLTS
jgi:hypothetical protein